MKVQLSSDSWHFKLQEFVWDTEMSRLENLCPYFWLTILSMIAFPFAASLHILRYPANKLLDLLDQIYDGLKKLDRTRKDKLENKIFRELSEAELTYYIMVYLNHFWASPYQDIVMAEMVYNKFVSLAQNPNEEVRRLINTYGDKARQLNELKKNIRSMKILAESEKRQRALRLAEMTRRFFTSKIMYVLYTVAIVATLSAALIYSQKLRIFMLAIVIALAIFATFLWLVVSDNGRYMLAAISKSPVFTKTRVAFGWILSPLKKVLLAAIKPFKLFIMFFVAVKNNYCPQIVWDDDDHKPEENDRTRVVA